MVDFVSIIVKNTNISVLERNVLLDFSMWRNLTEHGEYIPVVNKRREIKTGRNGEMIYKTPYKIAHYRGLDFTIFENGVIKLTGSLHKYFNDGIHNYNDFNYESFCAITDDIQSRFNILADNCILKTLETGVNIIPPGPANDILNYCFLHKTVVFEDKINSQGGRYKQAIHSQYLVKLYNKAIQSRIQGHTIPHEIMRHEVKFLKMEKLNKLGIYNINDIKKLGFAPFKPILLQEFKNILHYDRSIKSDNKNLDKYKNPLYWNELLSNKTRKTFYKHKGDLEEITKLSSNNIFMQTYQIISDKIDELI